MKFGKKNGKGIFKYAKNDEFCISYEGDFVNDLYHGNGKIKFTNKAEYEG